MTQRSVKFNTVMNMTRIGTGMLFPLITFPYIARVLGPSGMGKTNFANSLVAYFILLAAIGIPLYGTREVSKVRDDKPALTRLIQELIILHIASALLSIFVFGCAICFIEKLQSESKLFLIAGLSIPLSTLTMDWLYQGLEDFIYITIRSIAVMSASTIALFIFVKTSEDYLIFALITVIATLGSSVLNFWNARRLIFAPRSSPRNFRQHLKPLFKGHLLNFVISIYINLDTVMLGFLSTTISVGYYASAMKLTKMLLSMVSSFSSVLLPRLSYFIANDMKSEFDNMLKKALGITLMLCIPATTALILIREDIILAFAGSEYLPAAACIAITAPIILIIGLNGIFGFQVLYSMGKESAFILAVSSGAIINIVANFLLIPRIAHLGAAWGAAIAEFIILLTEIIMVRQFYRIQWPTIDIVKYVLAAIAMGASLLGLREIFATLVSWQRLVIEIPIATSLYFAILILFRDEYLLQTLQLMMRKLFPRLN